MKKGDYVHVEFDGIVLAAPKSVTYVTPSGRKVKGSAAVKITVRHPKTRESFWAIVPKETVKSLG